MTLERFHLRRSTTAIPKNNRMPNTEPVTTPAISLSLNRRDFERICSEDSEEAGEVVGGDAGGCAVCEGTMSYFFANRAVRMVVVLVSALAVAAGGTAVENLL